MSRASGGRFRGSDKTPKISKCRSCKQPLGELGIRSRRAFDRPGIVRVGGRYFHEACR